MQLIYGIPVIVDWLMKHLLYDPSIDSQMNYQIHSFQNMKF